MRTAAASPILFLLLISLFAIPDASASGFRLTETGAKAMGMGFAFTARADDPSSIYFNPAGMTQLEGRNVMAGLSYVNLPGHEFTGVTPLTGGAAVEETQKNLRFFLPNAYSTWKASPTFSYGAGIFTPFGLGQEYRNKETSVFRNQATRIELMTVAVNPSFAWKVSEALSVGAGIAFLYGSVDLEQTAVSPGPPLAPAGMNLFKVRMKGDGAAWGYNLGLLIKPSKNIRIGFHYRSPFTLRIKDADVKIMDNVISSPLFPSESRAEAMLRLPGTAAIGAAYMISDRLVLAVDGDWTFWSRFSELVITNKGSPALSSTTTKRWKDVVALRVGAEYRISDPISVRAGFAYDPTPVPPKTMGPELPDSDRLDYFVGLGLRRGSWTVDAAYYYCGKKDRTVDNLDLNGPGTGFDGTWKGEAHIVALDVSYRY